MITKKDIERINELAAIKKTRPLTDAENAEREKLKKLYVEAFKESLTGTLDNTYIVRPDGSQEKLKHK